MTPSPFFYVRNFKASSYCRFPNSEQNVICTFIGNAIVHNIIAAVGGIYRILR